MKSASNFEYKERREQMSSNRKYRFNVLSKIEIDKLRSMRQAKRDEVIKKLKKLFTKM